MNVHRSVMPLLVALCLAVFTASSKAQSNEENKKMINRSTPILHVKSVEPSLKFWTERFGFKSTAQVPEGNHIGFVALESGPIELMYQTFQGMQADPHNPLANAVDRGPSFIFMEVPDINAVIKSLEGAEIVQGLHDT